MAEATHHPDMEGEGDHFDNGADQHPMDALDPDGGYDDPQEGERAEKIGN